MFDTNTSKYNHPPTTENLKVIAEDGKCLEINCIDDKCPLIHFCNLTFDAEFTGTNDMCLELRKNKAREMLFELCLEKELLEEK